MLNSYLIDRYFSVHLTTNIGDVKSTNVVYGRNGLRSPSKTWQTRMSRDCGRGVGKTSLHHKGWDLFLHSWCHHSMHLFSSNEYVKIIFPAVLQPSNGIRKRVIGRSLKFHPLMGSPVKKGGSAFELLPFELWYVWTIARLNYCSFELLTWRHIL